MALITAAQFREHFPAIVGTGEDTLLNTLIARADALMAAFCGFPAYDSSDARTLEDQTYTLYLDAPRYDDDRCLDLGLRPIVSVTSANVDQNWDYDSSTAVAAGDLVLDARRGRLWLRPDASSSWVESARANKVVVVAGFATTPPDLAAACALAARHLMDLRPMASRTGATVQGTSTTRIDADELLPASVRQALGSYVLGGSRAG